MPYSPSQQGQLEALYPWFAAEPRYDGTDFPSFSEWSTSPFAQQMLFNMSDPTFQARQNEINQNTSFLGGFWQALKEAAPGIAAVGLGGFGYGALGALGTGAGAGTTYGAGLPALTSGMTEAGWGMGAGGLGGDAAGMAAAGGGGAAAGTWTPGFEAGGQAGFGQTTPFSGGLATVGAAAAASGFGQTTPFSGGLDTVGAGGLSTTPYTGGGFLDWLSSPGSALRGLGSWGSGTGSGAGGGAGMSSWLSPLMNIGSGLYGMSQADQMRKMAAMGGNINPNMWQTSGGQQMATDQLMGFMRDPTQLAATDPQFRLAQESAMRAGSMHGQNSGLVAKNAATASNDWYNSTTNRLAGLAGAPGNALGAYSAGMQGGTLSYDQMSRALASIGYGVSGLSGQTPMGITPQQQQRLIQTLLAQNGVGPNG